MLAIEIRVCQGGAEQIVQVNEGTNLMEALTVAGFTVSAPCGGHGRCGKCRVRITGGDAGAIHAEERTFLSDDALSGGWRLACKVQVISPLTLEIPSVDVGAKVLTDGADEAGEALLEPMCRLMDAALPLPSLQDQRSDVERLKDVLPAAEVDYAAMKALPDLLRAGRFRVSVFDGRVTGAFSKDARNLGVAVDVGTTTMAAYLMDLETGACLASDSCLNPQRVHGGDVISRSDFSVSRADGIELLQKMVVQAIDNLAGRMAEKAGVSGGDIRHVVCVGNTIMMHLLAGLTSRHIAVLPFAPVYSQAFSVKAAEIGLSCKNAFVTMAPCVAGYVGADTVAAILACGMDQKDGISLLIDIGTNGEIALGGKGGILCCSAAAGPAFEGAHIRCGSGAAEGAVDRVSLENGQVKLTAIGMSPARTICGSGLVDAVAAMKREGIMDETGRIDEDEIPAEYEPYLFELDGKPAFSLDGRGAEGVFICQKDLREVQLAKAAIAAGIDILMKEMDITFDRIDCMYLAGGFGNYIDQESGVEIGLLPEELKGRIHPVGNAAGSGAKKLLLSQAAFARCEAIRAHAGYIELSARPDFQELFVERMFF